jgi:hypothetical protein
MIKKKLLTVGLSTLLLGSTLFAQSNCVGGVCIINLDNLKPSKAYVEKSEPLVALAQPRFIAKHPEVQVENNDAFMVLEDKFDKTIDIVVDNEKIYVFPSYVMTDSEKVAYVQEQESIALNEKFNKEENKNVLVVRNVSNQTEEKILAKTILPTSDYYCEKDTHPIYDKVSNVYECV